MRIHLFVFCTHKQSIFIELYLLGWLFLKHIYECHDILMLDKSLIKRRQHINKDVDWGIFSLNSNKQIESVRFTIPLVLRICATVLVAAEHLYHLNAE